MQININLQEGIMITEKEITEVLKNELQPLPYVYAFWLEGSFAMGYADEYSDIDYWIDVDDDCVRDALEHVETALNRLGELDERDEIGNEHPKLGQIVYHMKESNPYLVLDFNWQMHSRDRKEYHYIKKDIVEGALVIFDKDNVVRFEEADEQEIARNKLKCRQECDYRYSQHLRVEKYISRGTFPESYAYYNKYVIEPLVMFLRLKYTPLYPYHYLLHISKHMPQAVIERLEKLIQVTTLEEMEIAMRESEDWYQELHEELF
jgi:predicted nucleotidyltransferase